MKRPKTEKTGFKNSQKYTLLCAAGILFTLPVASQDAPESLLPPGFNNPPSSPAPPPAVRPEQRPEQRPAQRQDQRPEQRVDQRPDQRPAQNNQQPSSESTSQNITEDSAQDTQTQASTDQDDSPARFILPTATKRSLGVVGVINQSQGGFNQSIFAGRDGEYLTRLVKNLDAPFSSRWATILMRRLLMSKTAAPNNVDGADWVAERAWLMLRMGESVGARQLVQQVDAEQYSNRLYDVSMPVFLANGDLAGFCPLTDGAVRSTDANSWKMSRAICLSLSGEQSQATSMLNRARRGQWATGVDYLLAEKAIGAGTNGRRAVKIEWEDVKGFNAWRHGLSIATGVKPPENLYNISGRHVRSWLVLAPMISVNDRILSSYAAAANGTLSNSAMVDLFASADEDPDASADSREMTDALSRAYTGDVDNRITAMKFLWNSRDSEIARYSMQTLTARAAARIMPSALSSEDIDGLIASMMTAGLDTQALAWSEYTDVGSTAWAQIMVGGNVRSAITAQNIDSFADQDQSVSARKTGFLIAAADGFGRINADDYQQIADDYAFNSRKENGWSKALAKAVERKDNGAVILLTAAGLQGNDWTSVPAFHIYHIVKALNAIGLNAEARMIAAEAIGRA